MRRREPALLSDYINASSRKNRGELRMIRRRAKSLKIVWAIVLGLIIAAPVFGNTITVTSTADNGPGSLRDAIATASNGDTINFSLSYPATITVSTPLTLGPNVTIIGPGAS